MRLSKGLATKEVGRTPGSQRAIQTAQTRPRKAASSALSRIRLALRHGCFGRGSALHPNIQAGGRTSWPGATRVALLRSATDASGRCAPGGRRAGREMRRELRAPCPRRFDEWIQVTLVNRHRTQTHPASNLGSRVGALPKGCSEEARAASRSLLTCRCSRGQ